MIRKARSETALSDNEIAKILRPHEQAVFDYIGTDLIYDFFAFVLADAFNKDCIWEDSTLEFEYIDALDYLRVSKAPGYKKLDLKRIKKILKEKYSLRITSENPIRIEKIQWQLNPSYSSKNLSILTSRTFDILYKVIKEMFLMPVSDSILLK